MNSTRDRISLQEWIDDSGIHAIRRFHEITAPTSHEVFVGRLYTEIRACLDALQRDAHQVAGDDEEKLSGHLIRQLAAAGYDASADTSSRGHVDLTVRVSTDQVFLWLGEAKKHKQDYGYLHDGLRQLLDRYATGREPAGGMVIYITQPKATDILGRWRKKVEDEKHCEYVETKKVADLDFCSSHTHVGSGLIVDVTHFAVVLHFEPTDEAARKKAARATKKAGTS